MNDLDCDALFLKFFDRWYSVDDRKSKGFQATRPDVLQNGSLIGLKQSEASKLPKDWQEKVRKQIDAMLKAARGDWATYLKVSGEVDLSWIDAFDRHYDIKRIEEIVKQSDPTDFSNDYVVLCCELGAALGSVICGLQPRFYWRFEWPYWESSLVDPKGGNVVPVFHWAIKKMSEYGWEDGLAAKLQACIQLLDEKEYQGTE